jgi:hypothetical protein
MALVVQALERSRFHSLGWRAVFPLDDEEGLGMRPDRSAQFEHEGVRGVGVGLQPDSHPHGVVDQAEIVSRGAGEHMIGDRGRLGGGKFLGVRLPPDAETQAHVDVAGLGRQADAGKLGGRVRLDSRGSGCWGCRSRVCAGDGGSRPRSRRVCRQRGLGMGPLSGEHADTNRNGQRPQDAQSMVHLAWAPRGSGRKACHGQAV